MTTFYQGDWTNINFLLCLFDTVIPWNFSLQQSKDSLASFSVSTPYSAKDLYYVLQVYGT